MLGTYDEDARGRHKGAQLATVGLQIVPCFGHDRYERWPIPKNRMDLSLVVGISRVNPLLNKNYSLGFHY